MNIKIKFAILCILSGIVTLTWLTGLVFADINYFIIAMVILFIALIPALKNIDEIKEFTNKKGEFVLEDEREEFIKEKAGYMTFGIFLALMVYCGVALLTLRNTFPEFTISSYIIFLLCGVSGIMYIISLQYYKRKHN